MQSIGQKLDPTPFIIQSKKKKNSHEMKISIFVFVLGLLLMEAEADINNLMTSMNTNKVSLKLFFVHDRFKALF